MVAQSTQRNEPFGLQRYNVLINQILLWAVFVYQAAAVIIFLVGLFLANRWLQQPFIGAFYEHTLVFNGTGSDSSDPAWELYGQVEVGDRLIFINEIPVHSALEVREILRERVPGENITATVLKTNGNEQTFDITLYNFPEASRTVYFVVPSILSAVFLVVNNGRGVDARAEQRHAPDGIAGARFFLVYIIPCHRHRCIF